MGLSIKIIGNIWADEPTCSHKPRGFLLVLVVTGSKGPQEPRIGRNVGCCQTGPAHEGAAVQTGNLEEDRKRCMIIASLCLLLFSVKLYLDSPASVYYKPKMYKK